MRKILNYCRYILFVLFVIALGLSVPCPGQATETNAGSNDIAVETKTLLVKGNNDSLLVGLADSKERKVGRDHTKENNPRSYIPLTDKMENYPVTNISAESILGDNVDVYNMSVTNTTYGTSGLLNCPVPIPSINNAQTGQSPYVTNPVSVKWVVSPYDDWGRSIYSWREGILILPDGDTVHCMWSYSEDYFGLVRLRPDGTIRWITENLSVGDYTDYVNLVVDDNNKIYIGTDGVYNSHGGLLICVDAETGNKEWEYDVGSGQTEPWMWSVWAGPVIHPDTGDIIFNGDHLISLDSSGNLNWEIERDKYFDEHGIAISPYNGYIYTVTYGGTKNGTSYDSHIYAFDVNGNEIYSYNLETLGLDGICDRHAPTITNDGTVLVGSSDNTLVAFNPDLTIKWSTNIYPDYNNWGIAMISNGALSPDQSVWYCPDWNSHLYAINAETGSVLWDIDMREIVGGYAYNEAGLVVDAEGKILFVGNPWGAANNSYLITVNPDGSIFSAIDLGVQAYISSTPAIAPDGTVYLNDWDDGYIFAIEGGTCTTDKTTLGKRPYCLYGKGM